MRGSTAGLSDKLKVGSNPYHDRLLAILDTLFSLFIVAPLVVGYWRGVWEQTTLYLFPHDMTTSGLISMMVGYVGHLFSTIFQQNLEQSVHPDQNRLTFYFVSRLYTIVLGFFGVNSWRGVWILLDIYTESEMPTLTAMTIVSLVALITMRAVRNLCSAPFSINIDQVQGYFASPTMFRVTSTKKDSRMGQFLLDCLFSVFVVGVLVVIVWRAVWVMMDICLYPDQPGKSAMASLVVGYILSLIVFCLQPIMKWTCEKTSGLGRVLIADFYLFTSFVATVNVWRGIWNALNVYYLPDDLELSTWTSHLVCLIILLLLNVSNTMLVRGVFLDGEEPGGDCVVFPCYYLRVYFQKEREKKQRRQQYLDFEKLYSSEVIRKQILNQEIKTVSQCVQCEEPKYSHKLEIDSVIESSTPSLRDNVPNMSKSIDRLSVILNPTQLDFESSESSNVEIKRVSKVRISESENTQN